MVSFSSGSLFKRLLYLSSRVFSVQDLGEQPHPAQPGARPPAAVGLRGQTSLCAFISHKLSPSLLPYVSYDCSIFPFLLLKLPFSFIVAFTVAATFPFVWNETFSLWFLKLTAFVRVFFFGSLTFNADNIIVGHAIEVLYQALQFCCFNMCLVRYTALFYMVYCYKTYFIINLNQKLLWLQSYKLIYYSHNNIVVVTNLLSCIKHIRMIKILFKAWKTS